MIFQNFLQRHRNISPVATVSDVIELNSATSIKIADATPNRISFYVNVDGIMGNNSIYIKLQAASIDNIKKGIWIGRQGVIFNIYWDMSPDNIYLGEISAIAATGSPIIYVTEY